MVGLQGILLFVCRKFFYAPKFLSVVKSFFVSNLRTPCNRQPDKEKSPSPVAKKVPKTENSTKKYANITSNNRPKEAQTLVPKPPPESQKKPDSILKSVKPSKPVKSKIPEPSKKSERGVSSRSEQIPSQASNQHKVPGQVNALANSNKSQAPVNAANQNQNPNSTSSPSAPLANKNSNRDKVRPKSDRPSSKRTKDTQQAEDDFKQLLKDNQRLKKENLSLKSKIVDGHDSTILNPDQNSHTAKILSTPSRNSNSSKNHQSHTNAYSALTDPKNKENEDSDIFNKLNELEQENQTLREKNAELVLIQSRTDRNYQHIKSENSDLKTRILHLERVVSITHTPSSLGARSLNGNNLAEFSLASAMSRDQTFDSARAPSNREVFTRESVDEHENNIVNILSQRRVVSGHKNAQPQVRDKKRAALRSMNSLASTLASNEPEERLPNSSYLLDGVLRSHF